MLKHCIYIYDGSISPYEVVHGLNHAIVVWFVSSCYSDSAISVHGFDEVRRPTYNHPLHRKVLKHFIYIYDVSISHYEVVPSLNHVIVVCFVSSC